MKITKTQLRKLIREELSRTSRTRKASKAGRMREARGGGRFESEWTTYGSFPVQTAAGKAYMRRELARAKKLGLRVEPAGWEDLSHGDFDWEPRQRFNFTGPGSKLKKFLDGRRALGGLADMDALTAAGETVHPAYASPPEQVPDPEDRDLDDIEHDGFVEVPDVSVSAETLGMSTQVLVRKLQAMARRLGAQPDSHQSNAPSYSEEYDTLSIFGPQEALEAFANEAGELLGQTLEIEEL